MSHTEAIPELAHKVGELLRQRGLTLGLAESATGGLISSWLTSIPGSSAYFAGSVVAYDNQVKVQLLGVRAETVSRHGAVSEPVAAEMAACARERLQTHLGLADTGITGPSGATEGKPVGLFYVALASEQRTAVQQHQFAGDRLSIRRQAAIAALELLRQRLEASNVL